MPLATLRSAIQASPVRHVEADPLLRAKLGARAKDDMARLQSEAKRGNLLRELETIWLNRSFLPTRSDQTPRLRHLQELLADRDRKIGQLESDLRWIESKAIYRIFKALKGLVTRNSVQE